MRIGFHGLDLPDGKQKYADPVFQALVDKFCPKKTSPFFAEFLRDECVQCDGILVAHDSLLDILIMDIEKLETRKARGAEGRELALIDKCLDTLEKETPIGRLEFVDGERELVRSLAPVTLKPMAIVDETPELSEAITRMLDATQTVLFYTAGNPEVHAWPVAAGSDIVTCAGKIHSDLARGFIRADVVSHIDLLECHNMNDARAKGLVEVVDREYVVRPGDVIEVRFSV
jgi:hypothetical protein